MMSDTQNGEACEDDHSTQRDDSNNGEAVRKIIPRREMTLRMAKL